MVQTLSIPSSVRASVWFGFTGWLRFGVIVMDEWALKSLLPSFTGCLPVRQSNVLTRA